MKIQAILDHIDLREIALPKFQRGYVWNRDQVRGLMQSLYRGYPVGSLLVWATKDFEDVTKGTTDPDAGSIKLLLDGQQRITTLYGIIKGAPPEFFDGNENVFKNLYFNLEDESFEFYGPLKMKDNPLWIDITDLMQRGVASYIQQLMATPDIVHENEKFGKYIGRLNALEKIKDIDLHIDTVSGIDKNVDVVVDIFNRVNSGGTKLSKGDLALARICGLWPEAREEMKSRLEKWKRYGFEFKLDWFLRCITTLTTGEAFFSFLKDVSIDEFKEGITDSEKLIDSLLNLISSRLGLDHDRVLGSRYSFPLLVRYLAQRGGTLFDHKERDKLLYWYIHTFLWGRYAGSTESYLNQDLGLIEENDGALDRLIENLRKNRGDLNVHSADFLGWSRGARFYPLIYMLTRVWHAQDWGTGVELSEHMLGYHSNLQVHHVFPKAFLYKHGYTKEQVNSLANFVFLTQETNLKISDRNPTEYLEEISERFPGALESHWIPMERELWHPERYLDFLAARRELLAQGANQFLNSLLHGEVPETEISIELNERTKVCPGCVENEEELQQLIDVNDWVQEQGLPSGELEYMLNEDKTGEMLAMIDLAWPRGLQEGYSQPAAILLNESKEISTIVNSAGFRYFTDIEQFKQYVATEILSLEGSYVSGSNLMES